jgi:hypothetical protein
MMIIFHTLVHVSSELPSQAYTYYVASLEARFYNVLAVTLDVLNEMVTNCLMLKVD